ncbi:MAG: hypothetical protein WBZ42_10340 [Halobacteriota archaeon]
MSAAENYPALLVDDTLPKHELLEIHRSKISIHRAKTNYDYPIIRLPHQFSALAGLPTRIYQTVHDGALAFLGKGGRLEFGRSGFRLFSF